MKLIYVYDALCGWCYGFSGIITEFVGNHPELTDVEVISGGMVRGERVGPISGMASYLSKAYKEVEDRTGVKFGDAFLNETLVEGTAILNSLPPSIALSIFKTKKPEEQLQFASGIQKAIYYDGKKPEDPNLYSELALPLGSTKQNLKQIWMILNIELLRNRISPFANNGKLMDFLLLF
jgi:putative protein-disulfide isomerase